MNIKAAILASIVLLPFEVVPVPEFGEGVELRISVMSGFQREAFESHWRDLSKDNTNLNSMGFGVCLLLHCVTDEQGAQVFGASDFNTLMQVNSLVLGRLIKKALAVNKILTENLEDTEKNS